MFTPRFLLFRIVFHVLDAGNRVIVSYFFYVIPESVIKPLICGHSYENAIFIIIPYVAKPTSSHFLDWFVKQPTMHYSHYLRMGLTVKPIVEAAPKSQNLNVYRLVL